MAKKVLLLIIIFYFLILLQTSFLVHFYLWGFAPNLVFLLVILINLFEEKEGFIGFFSAFLAGLLLDIFSNRPIGFNIAILLAMALFIKFIFKKYVQLPFGEKI